MLLLDTQIGEERYDRMTYEKKKKKKKKFSQWCPKLNVLHHNSNFETFEMSIFVIDCC